jgi:hypothetical protein
MGSAHATHFQKRAVRTYVELPFCDRLVAWSRVLGHLTTCLPD